MTRRIFEFQCPDGHISESLIDDSEVTAECKVCDKQAKRIVSAVACSLDALSGHFPGETMKWAKNRQDVIRKERKANGE